MARRDLVLIGGSAGGLEALLRILDRLPGDFPAAILVVLHIPARGSELLPTVVQRRCQLPVAFAEDGAPIPYGAVAIAPPDRHLKLGKDGLMVVQGPHENRHRPSLDPLFRSAGELFGPRAIGVVLSGSGGDGAAGMSTLRRQGGYLIVQDVEDALFPMMPQSVLDAVDVDACLTTDELPDRLTALVQEDVSITKEADVDANRQRQPDRDDPFLKASIDRDQPGRPSVFSCPDCGGVLWEDRHDKLVHFRCRVGHSYSTETLIDAQRETYEDALWSALRALEEKVDLYRGLARMSGENGQDAARQRYEAREAEYAPHIEVIKGLLGT